MAATHPVLIIHAKKNCPACEALLKEPYFSKFKSVAKRVNPNVEFQVVHHENWDTKSGLNSPKIGRLTYAPIIMVVPSEHANPQGNIDSSLFYGFTFDRQKNTVVPERTNLTRELWLEKVLNPESFDSHARKYPSNYTPERRNTEERKDTDEKRDHRGHHHHRDRHGHHIRSTRESGSRRSSRVRTSRHSNKSNKNEKDSRSGCTRKIKIVSIR